MRDEEDLGFLADAEPQDHQRDDGEMRHVAQHLQGGIEQELGRLPQPVDDAEDETDRAADDEAFEGAQAGHADGLGERTVLQALPEGDGDRRQALRPARGRHRARLLRLGWEPQAAVA